MTFGSLDKRDAHPVILMFCGKGGVGKTTCASSTAIHYAAEGFRTLLISTDPAPSLTDILEVDVKGKIIVEKSNDFYHVILSTSENESYALVPNLELKSRSSNLVQFDNKYVEISGYKRIRDSKEFPIENSIGVMSIKVIE